MPFTPEAIRTCRGICREHARSFYWASFALPKAKRHAAWVVYAFCRVSDSLADLPGGNASARLALWSKAVRKGFAGGSGNVVIDAFVPVCRQHGIPFSLVRQLIQGLSDDVKTRRYESFAELEAYCIAVAAVPGLMMLHVLGCSDPGAAKPAAALGVAMQLTNILRDVREDAQRGKVYLPRDELAEFGYSTSDLIAGLQNESWRRLLDFQIARARSYYDASNSGLQLLPSDSRLCVRLCSAFYRSILSELSHPGFSVFHARAAVPTWKKTLLLLHQWVASMG